MTSQTNTLQYLASLTIWHRPLLFCSRSLGLHMLCQMAENEGVAGEAGVFHSLLPDNAPSGVGERLPPSLTSCQLGTNREDNKEKWDGMGWELGE